MSAVSCSLPKLTPRSTPMTGGITVGSLPATPKPKVISAHQMMIPKAYEVYPQRLPTASDIPKRPVNVLRPQPPLKFDHMLETAEGHLFNDKRTDRMKQREHYRYHNAWSKYYYGSEPEKESYRSHTRSVLKQQMLDKDRKAQEDYGERIKESMVVSERDTIDKQQDADRFLARFKRLKGYRDENKKLMEWHWHNNRESKSKEDTFDREQLRYNPINWSCTLK